MRTWIELRVAGGESRESPQIQEAARCVLELERWASNMGKRPVSVASTCICSSIIGRDPTRHFRECPLRETYPDPPTGSEWRLLRIFADVSSLLVDASPAERLRVLEAVQVLVDPAKTRMPTRPPAPELGE